MLNVFLWELTTINGKLCSVCKQNYTTCVLNMCDDQSKLLMFANCGHQLSSVTGKGWLAIAKLKPFSLFISLF